HRRAAYVPAPGDARRAGVGWRAVVLDGVPRLGRGRRVCRDHPAETSIPGAPGVGARQCRAPTPGARRPRPTCAPFAGSATFRRPQAIPHATDTFAIERP